MAAKLALEVFDVAFQDKALPQIKILIWRLLLFEYSLQQLLQQQRRTHWCWSRTETIKSRWDPTFLRLCDLPDRTNVELLLRHAGEKSWRCCVTHDRRKLLIRWAIAQQCWWDDIVLGLGPGCRWRCVLQAILHDLCWKNTNAVY